MDSEIIIKIENLNKSYPVNNGKVQALKNIGLEINKGEFIVIEGPSACGKTTLLHTILGLEKPDTGNVNILGNDIYKISEEEMTKFRKRHIGMIYQKSNWLKELDIEENVYMPLMMCGVTKNEAIYKARLLLERVGLIDRVESLPVDISSGQQKKVAFARALVNDPEIIMADEPTGNLDHNSALEIINLLIEEKTKGKTVILVTSNLEFLKFADKQVHIVDGRILE